MGGILNPQWNHWLFSRLLKRDWPAAWTAEELPPVRREAAPTRRENLLKHVARNILFSLPFPRVKGFSLRQSFDLSVVLTLNRTGGTTPSRSGCSAIRPRRLPASRIHGGRSL